MKRILKNIYFSNDYHGVLVGAIELERGVILIDSPLLTDSVRDWMAEVDELDAGPERLLVYLDSHPDRSLGAKLMDIKVLAQKATFDDYRKMSAVFKGNKFETGSDWEFYSGFPGIRWQKPSISFTEDITIHWGALDVVVEHHPGPQDGACWVVVPGKKVAFVGDTVVTRQPPFLAEADLPKWIETLDVMLSKEYKDYRFYSSRSGKVDEKDIRSMRKCLVDMVKRLERLAKRKAKPEDTEKLISKLLDATNPPAKHRVTYEYRLRYGLKNYYINHYVVEDSEEK
jgi:glyoxylase-like metal-dependent hydrolase (beta-lactamase superfamily II)